MLAMLPTDKAHLLVTTELTGVMTARIVDAPSRAVMIDVPIEPRYAPNVYLNVAYVQDGEMYTHDRMLERAARRQVPRTSKSSPTRRSTSRARPRRTRSSRAIRTARRRRARKSVWASSMKRSTAFSPIRRADIRKAFYGRRYNQVQTSFTISYYFTGYSGDKPLNLAANKRAYQLADFKNEGQYAEPTIRKDFKDTTFWQPDIVTGATARQRLR